MVTDSFRRLKQWTSRQFYWFGRHCAKHTMVVLLTSGVVITVLVYPALFIQLDASSNRSSTSRPRGGGAWSTFISNPRSFSSSGGVMTAPLVHEIWEGLDALRLRDDAAVVARCGVQSTIAIERLFVHGYSDGAGRGDGSPVLGPIPALKDSKRLLEDIERYLRTQAPHSLLECVKDASGRCFIMSPLTSDFDHDSGLNGDQEVTYRRALPKLPPVAGIPVHIGSIVARQSNGYGPGSAPDDLVNNHEYLVLTFALKADSGDCQSIARHVKWLDLLKTTVAPNGVITPASSLPDLFAFEYDPSGSRTRFSRFSALIYLTYVVIFVYFSGSLRRIDTLHDRYGMAFTGIVEIIMSTLCSISVCEIIGFRPNMVPREILPVIIVFVGAENMFTMVEDVVTTRITLPVKERIGIGLSKSGTSNTIKVVSYNALLGTIAFFSTGAIHQFCVFAIVVLIIHWIHINTMFIGVLAIDLHRLELSDHLSQNTMMKSSTGSTVSMSTKTKTTVKKTIPSGTRIRGFRGTAATNGSLLLMLALAGALYYTTYSNSKADLTASTTGGVERDAYARALNTSHLDVAPDPAALLWDLFNPTGDTFLHVKIEPPFFITFSPDGGVLARSNLSERGQRPSLTPWIVIGPLLQLWKIIIVPTFVTNFLLWLILRHLMRDAELIEAQRHREDGDDAPLLEGGGRPAERIPPINGLGASSSSSNRIVSYKQLERACANDVMLVASSSDASVIAALSTEHELAVWFDSDGRHASINCAPLLRPAIRATTSPPNGADGTNITTVKHRATHLALDSRGAWCALATDGGLLAIWSLAKGSAILQCRALVAPGSGPGGRIRNIIFISPGTSPSTSRSTSTSSMSSTQQSRAPASRKNAALVITDDRGNVYTWAFLASPVPTIMATKSKQTPHSRRSSISSTGESAAIQQAATSTVPCTNGLGTDVEKHLCAKLVAVHGETTLLVACASSTNSISVKDAMSDVKICVIDDPMFRDADVDRAHVGALDARPCRTCLGTKPAVIVLAASSKGVVHVYHIPCPGVNDAVSCSCAQPDLFEHSARRPSHKTTPVITPLKMRRKTSSTSSVGQDSPQSPTSKDYPMYGHGVHSRREKTRDFGDDQAFLVPPHMSNSEVQSPEMSNTLHKVIKIAMIPCDRGGWDITGGAVIGVRKRTRGPSLPPKSVDAYVATLRGEIPQQTASRTSMPFGGWEVWMLDSTGTLRASGITDLPHTPRGLMPVDEDDHSSGLFFRPPQLTSPTFSDITSQSIVSETVAPVRVYPRIPFTRASCFSISPSGEHCLVGFGNTALVIQVPRDLDHSTNPARQHTGLWTWTWTWTVFSFLRGLNTS